LWERYIAIVVRGGQPLHAVRDDDDLGVSAALKPDLVTAPYRLDRRPRDYFNEYAAHNSTN
jgi:hypothetical protein